MMKTNSDRTLEVKLLDSSLEVAAVLRLCRKFLESSAPGMQEDKIGTQIDLDSYDKDITLGRLVNLCSVAISTLPSIEQNLDLALKEIERLKKIESANRH